MDDDTRELVEKIHREAIAAMQPYQRPQEEPPTLAYRDLPEAKPDDPLCHEWNFYRSQVERLLAEGHEGRWVLIKGEQLIGIWDTLNEARAIGFEKYGMQPRLIHQIRSRERLIRMSQRYWACQK